MLTYNEALKAAGFKGEGLTPKETLDRIYALRLERADMTRDLEEQIFRLTTQIQEKTADIDREIDSLESEAKEACMNLGESIKGSYLQVIYTKGKEIFDVARIKATLPVTYTEFLTTTKPSVRIADIKAKEK